MLALANALSNERLQRAFSTVAREAFLGDGAWEIATPHAGYLMLPENDPALIYQDVAIGLAKERGVNNGSPALHARWINALAPQEGETIFHIGAGTGYYTAILAQLVGSSGKVVAIEFNEALAKQLKKNLSGISNIEVRHGDGAHYPDRPVDGVYVNFGVSRPADPWVEMLKLGGRLILPLGAPKSDDASHARPTAAAIGLLVRRVAEGYAAVSLGRVMFIFVEGRLGGLDPDVEKLRASLENAKYDGICSLSWRQPSKQPTWFDAEGWAISLKS